MLDIWAISNAQAEYGAVSIDTLPMIKQAVRCPECQGDDATDADVEKLRREMECRRDDKTFLG